MKMRTLYLALAAVMSALVVFIWWHEADAARQRAWGRPLPDLRNAPTRLVPCTVCDGKVSSGAKACPHCGDPR